MFRTLVAFAIVLVAFSPAGARDFKHIDSDTTRYPINERYGDPYSQRGNSFDLRDTGFIKRSIEYDARTRRYYVIEKVGNRYYRKSLHGLQPLRVGDSFLPIGLISVHASLKKLKIILL